MDTDDEVRNGTQISDADGDAVMDQAPETAAVPVEAAVDEDVPMGGSSDEELKALEEAAAKAAAEEKARQEAAAKAAEETRLRQARLEALRADAERKRKAREEEARKRKEAEERAAEEKKYQSLDGEIAKKRIHADLAMKTIEGALSAVAKAAELVTPQAAKTVAENAEGVRNALSLGEKIGADIDQLYQALGFKQPQRETEALKELRMLLVKIGSSHKLLDAMVQDFNQKFELAEQKRKQAEAAAAAEAEKKRQAAEAAAAAEAEKKRKAAEAEAAAAKSKVVEPLTPSKGQAKRAVPEGGEDGPASKKFRTAGGAAIPAVATGAGSDTAPAAPVSDAAAAVAARSKADVATNAAAALAGEPVLPTTRAAFLALVNYHPDKFAFFWIPSVLKVYKNAPSVKSKIEEINGLARLAKAGLAADGKIPDPEDVKNTAVDAWLEKHAGSSMAATLVPAAAAAPVTVVSATPLASGTASGAGASAASGSAPSAAGMGLGGQRVDTVIKPAASVTGAGAGAGAGAGSGSGSAPAPAPMDQGADGEEFVPMPPNERPDIDTALEKAMPPMEKARYEGLRDFLVNQKAPEEKNIQQLIESCEKTLEMFGKSIIDDYKRHKEDGPESFGSFLSGIQMISIYGMSVLAQRAVVGDPEWVSKLFQSLNPEQLSLVSFISLLWVKGNAAKSLIAEASDPDEAVAVAFQKKGKASAKAKAPGKARAKGKAKAKKGKGAADEEDEE